MNRPRQGNQPKTGWRWGDTNDGLCLNKRLDGMDSDDGKRHGCVEWDLESITTHRFIDAPLTSGLHRGRLFGKLFHRLRTSDQRGGETTEPRQLLNDA